MMDYYLKQIYKGQKINIDHEFRKLGAFKRKIIEAKQRDFQERKDIAWIYPSIENTKHFPVNTTLIKISFRLARPYISRDDSEIYTTTGENPLENPIVRDKFTGFSMIKTTGWKGHLRFSAGKVEGAEYRNRGKIIRRLFGDSDKKDVSTKGRLYFYPSFFQSEVYEDIITPIDRKSRKASNLVNIEVIPQGSEAEFYLLYFPYLLSNEKINEDLVFLGEALKLMFYTYGFSAKKSSGFGIIHPIKDKDLEVYPGKFKDYFRTLLESGQGGDK